MDHCRMVSFFSSSPPTAPPAQPPRVFVMLFCSPFGFGHSISFLVWCVPLFMHFGALAHSNRIRRCETVDSWVGVWLGAERNAFSHSMFCSVCIAACQRHKTNRTDLVETDTMSVLLRRCVRAPMAIAESHCNEYLTRNSLVPLAFNSIWRATRNVILCKLYLQLIVWRRRELRFAIANQTELLLLFGLRCFSLVCVPKGILQSQ